MFISGFDKRIYFSPTILNENKDFKSVTPQQLRHYLWKLFHYFVMY